MEDTPEENVLHEVFHQYWPTYIPNIHNFFEDMNRKFHNAEQILDLHGGNFGYRPATKELVFFDPIMSGYSYYT